MLNSIFKSQQNVIKNIAANFIGRGFGNILSFIFVPIYINLLGIESYGLIGFQGIFSLILGLLDAGMAQAFSRELAIVSCRENKSEPLNEKIRSFEVFYWLIACIILLISFPLSYLISEFWLSSNHLSTETIQKAVLFMGFEIGFRLPGGLYGGGLIGLQRQTNLNAIIMLTDTMRFCGTTLILMHISNSIILFFISQLAVSILGTLLTGFFLWRTLPSNNFFASKFSLPTLMKSSNFAISMSGVTLSNLLLSQVDKIALSKLVTLEAFGYYSLAARIVSAISGLIFHPILLAVLPRFTELLSSGRSNEGITFFHKANQLVTISTATFCSVVIFFSYDLILLWTRNSELAKNASVLLSILTCSNLFFFFPAGPWILRYAHGKVSIAIYINLIAAIILLPTLILITPRFGLIGAAISTIPIYAIHCIIMSFATFKLWFNHERNRWFLNDVFYPFIACFFTTLIIYIISYKSSIPSLIFIGMSIIIGFISSVLASIQIRDSIVNASKRFIYQQTP